MMAAQSADWRMCPENGAFSGLRALAMFLCVVALGMPPVVVAEVEEFTITARKRDAGETLQEVPFAVSAFSSEELEARLSNDLTSLSYRAPNVGLADIGTTRGVANFTIRGLGINSSIPSIDPTVGVFVDGIYMGISAGVINDFFDMEGVEILRGPQGLLFGRNVTGGAVLLRTRKPTDEFEMTLRGISSKAPKKAEGSRCPDRSCQANSWGGWPSTTRTTRAGTRIWLIPMTISVPIVSRWRGHP